MTASTAQSQPAKPKEEPKKKLISRAGPDSPCVGPAEPPRAPRPERTGKWWDEKAGIWKFGKKIIIVPRKDYPDIEYSPATSDEKIEPILSTSETFAFEKACKISSMNSSLAYQELISAFLDANELNHDVIKLAIADTLDVLSLRNSVELSTERITLFHALKISSMSLWDYIARIFRLSFISIEASIIALIYLNRIMHYVSDLKINPYTAHRLTITAFLLAAKFFDDQFLSNASYAKIGGIPTGSEMNTLEFEFLFGIGFHLYVEPAEFTEYLYKLEYYCKTEMTRKYCTVVPFSIWYSDDKSKTKTAASDTKTSPNQQSAITSTANTAANVDSKSITPSL